MNCEILDIFYDTEKKYKDYDQFRLDYLFGKLTNCGLHIMLSIAALFAHATLASVATSICHVNVSKMLTR